MSPLRHHHTFTAFQLPERLVLWLGVIAVACAPPYPPPPDTRREVVVDSIHREAIPDPYRWLEARDHEDTRAWLAAQNAHTETVVGETPLRDSLRVRFRQLLDVPDVGNPIRRGDLEYFSLRRRGDELPRVMRRPAAADEGGTPIDPAGSYEVVLDPVIFDSTYRTRVTIQSLSPDGGYMVYAIRRGGEDETELRVRDLSRDADLPDRLPRALYSGVSFDQGGSGFYYVRRSRDDGPRVLFHTLGADPARDSVLFGEDYGPTVFAGMRRADEGRLHIFTAQHGWASTDVFVWRPELPFRVPLVYQADARFTPMFVDGTMYLHTNLEAPNNRLIAVDLDQPEPPFWRDVIPETEDVLLGVSDLRGRWYARYLRDVNTEIRVYERDGTPAGQIDVPAAHTATIRPGPGGRVRLSLSSFTVPTVEYLVDLETGEREVWDPSPIAFDGDEYSVRQVWYPSHDGTSVPMYIVHRADLERTGDHPTLLTGYGGFNVSQTPRFSPSAAVWLEFGGVYAVPNLRGGGEYGETWHRAGMLENKQNVFDDFIAAAEWLIAEGYTNPQRLAIRGGSNGGLLVAAAFTQRPELFRAVLCAFPDLDMIRFHTFTRNNNAPALLEYGDASRRDHYAFLREYSPYQRVTPETAYPAVMFTSGDLDTRVPPLQARKMTARMQHATSSGLPVILRYDPMAGHAAGRGRPMSRTIEDSAMEMAFLMSQVGIALPEEGGR